MRERSENPSGFILEPEALTGAFVWLVQVLGQSWLDEQRRLPPHKSHTVAIWFSEPLRFITDESFPERGSFLLSGNFQELKAFAIDVALLSYHERLPPDLVARIKNSREYQGARYELAVAAWFVRMGLLPVWNQGTGPEFFVDLTGTDCRLAVEAKSRRRRGHLGFPGGRESSFRAGDVDKLFKVACKTDAKGFPLLIFIDLNAPDEPDAGPEGHPAWSPKTKWLTRKYELQEREAPFALAVFTNIAWHFAGRSEVDSVPPFHFFVPPKSSRPLRYDVRSWA